MNILILSAHGLPSPYNGIGNCTLNIEKALSSGCEFLHLDNYLPELLQFYKK